MSLPVADPWFVAAPAGPGVTVIEEPHVCTLMRANMWLVEGTERDMLIDSGMGVAPISGFVDGLRRDPSKPLLHVLSHAHIDHVGGAHEYETVMIHKAEADALRAREPIATLRRENLPDRFLKLFRDSGYAPLPEILVDALPHADYDIDAYDRLPCEPTMLLEEGDRIDLGGRSFEVLHFPGHSEGGIGLLDGDGVFFAGDVIYDGPLILSDQAAYVASLERLAALEVSVVHAGHDPSFDQARMREICADYLDRWR